MKLLITGGCGFLGSNLAAEAMRRGIELVLLDNLSRHGGTSNLEWLRGQGNFTFIQADVRDPAVLDDAIATHRPDQVFHLAGQVAMTTSLASPRDDFEINAMGTLNLLEAVRRHAPQTVIVYSSTNKVYGDLEQYTYTETDTRYQCVECPDGFDENVTLSFASPYGCSKGAADQYILDYARVFGLRTVVFRHSSMYGGRQFSTFDQGWIGWFCQKALEASRGELDGPITIHGNGKQVRDVLHASDMIRLYFSVYPNIGQAAGQAFNIGGGIAQSLSLLELLQSLGRMTDQHIVPHCLAPRQSDQRFFVADVGKAERLLGWKPQTTTEEGLREALAWARTL